MSKQSFEFTKEKILPTSDPRSPFYYNLPPYDSKPIDNLIEFFKFWKYFIKSTIYYLKEIVLVKELESNLNYQLIQAVQFPGCKDLPNKILQDIQINNPNINGTISPKNNTTPTKELKKNLSSSSLTSLSTVGGGGSNNNNNNNNSSFNNQSYLQQQQFNNNNGSSTSLSNSIPHGPLTSSASSIQNLPPPSSSLKSNTPPIEKQRPGLFKTKSNNNSSFLKNAATNLHKKNSSLTSLRQLAPTSTNISTTSSGSNSPSHHGIHPHLPHHPHIHSDHHVPQLHTHHQQQQQQHSTQQFANGATTPPLPISKPETLHSNDVKIPPTFFPDNSLYTTLPALLLSSHHHAFNNSYKLRKDLISKIIPRLEVLLKQVSHKIKEIKLSLKNDAFANPELSKEISKTGQILSKYMASVETYCGPRPVVKNRGLEEDEEEYAALDDPLLLKLKVDSRLKTQLVFENYMFASYLNLQNISKDLFTYLLKELNLVCDKCGKLDLATEFYQYLKSQVSQSSSKDWEYFISHNKCFVNTFESTEENPKRDIRTMKSIDLPYSNLPQNKCLRFGIMYKKSKLMKNYTRYYYVLSCNYLHEFKFEEETHQPQKKTNKSKDKIGGFIGFEDEPVKSYNLNDYQIATKDESSFKFTLTKVSNKSKKTFKLNNLEDYHSWFEDLFELLKYGSDHHARFAYIQRKVDIAANSKTLENGKKKNSKGLSLELGNYSTPALSGMFTPRIRTPQESPTNSSDTNPFDEVFSNLPTKSKPSSDLSSPAMTPRNLTPTDSQFNINQPPQPLQQPTTNQIQIPQQPPTTNEEFLKLQEAFMKQQQEIMDLRSKEQANINLIQRKLENLQLVQQNNEEVLNSDQNSLNTHQRDSSESLNSFIAGPPNKIPVAHAAVEGLTSRPIEFDIGDNNKPNNGSNSNSQSPKDKLFSGSNSSIPQVFVTEN
ncbi:ASK10 [Candida jiufengensis]|uniref:ASK10 n=1 Tax=Candida jiufengensis TaxID=497108 RepID=UPI002225629A|nr:ASK10 [Candida jiufengensis]KAI5956186.1 ASK10 [Candida jiufengensis]